MVCFCFSVWKWTKLWGHNFYSFSSGVFSPTATGEQNQAIQKKTGCFKEQSKGNSNLPAQHVSLCTFSLLDVAQTTKFYYSDCYY